MSVASKDFLTLIESRSIMKSLKLFSTNLNDAHLNVIRSIARNSVCGYGLDELEVSVPPLLNLGRYIVSVYHGCFSLLNRKWGNDYVQCWKFSHYDYDAPQIKFEYCDLSLPSLLNTIFSFSASN